jgi:hypothetical protein
LGKTETILKYLLGQESIILERVKTERVPTKLGMIDRRGVERGNKTKHLPRKSVPRVNIKIK